MHSLGRCHRGFAGGFWLLAILLAIVPTARRTYALPESLSGSIRLIGVNTDNQGADTRSVNQEYSARWTRAFATALRTRAAISYERYGADLGEGTEIWREELRPTAAATYKRSWWSMTGTYAYRRATSNDRTTDLNRNQFGILAHTQAVQYPILNIGIDLESAYNSRNRSSHDVQRTRLYGSVNYTTGAAGLFFSSSFLHNSNRAANLKTDEGRHMFRWNQAASLMNQRLRIGSTYHFSRRSQTNTTLDADTALRVIEPNIGLYLRDATPEFDPLDTAVGLIDGDYATPVEPEINIGQGQLDQNIGLDLGFPRELAALYIYTDGPSGSALRWTLYVSGDNVTWTSADPVTRTFYNTAAERYELTFEPLTARYVKAVNSGTNEILAVRVTEIEAQERITIPEKESRRQTVHQVNLITGYSVSHAWQTTLDLDLRMEPGGDFTAGRSRAYAGLSVRHQPSTGCTQSVRAQTGWEKYRAGHAEERNRSLNYTLLVSPLPVAGLSFSAQTRQSSADGLALQETNTLSTQGYAQLLPGLRLSSEAAYARNNILLSGRKFSTWTAHAAADMKVTRTVDLSATALYQTTRELDMDQRTVHRRYSADAQFRVTPSLSLRAAVALSLDGRRRYLVQDYALSWSLSRSLSLSALAQTNLEDSIARSRRRIVSLNLAVSHRTTVFASYLYSGADEDSQPELRSVQLGLTSGF